MQQIMNQPLDDAELDLLSSFLEGAGASAMNIEMLDGFFAALIQSCPANTCHMFSGKRIFLTTMTKPPRSLVWSCDTGTPLHRRCF